MASLAFLASHAKQGLEAIIGPGSYGTRGFGAVSRLSTSSIPFDFLKRLDFADLFEDNFFCVLPFCIFRSSKFWRKKALGIAEPSSFWKRHLSHFFGARANLTRSGRAGVSGFLSELGSLPKMALQLRCVGFLRLLGFFCSAPISQASSAPLHTPLFLFRCFCLLFAFSLELGTAPHCTCVFLGSWPSRLFFGGLFLSFYKKHCFFPWEGGNLG